MRKGRRLAGFILCAMGCIPGLLTACKPPSGPEEPPPSDSEPDQVTGLQASQGTYLTQINLAWNPADNAAKYYVYEAASASGTYGKLAGEAASTSAAVTGIPQGTHLYYKVAGVSSTDKEGELSASAEGWTGLPAPSGLSATQGTYTDRIELGWGSVTNAANYYIYTASSSGGTYSLWNSLTGTSTSYSTSATAHVFFKVAALDSFGKIGAQSSYAEGWVSPAIQTIAWQNDGLGFIQFSTNDPANYETAFYAAVSGSYMSTSGATCSVQTKKISGNASGSYGIVFGYTSSTNFFGLLIDTQRYFIVFQVLSGTVYILQSWTYSGYLNAGYSVLNTLKTIYYYNYGGYDYQDIYLNGNYIGSIDGSPGTLDGYAGFWVSVLGSSDETFPGVPVDARFKMTSPVALPNIASSERLSTSGAALRALSGSGEPAVQSLDRLKIRSIAP